MVSDLRFSLSRNLCHMAQTFFFPYADFSGTFPYEPRKISWLFWNFHDRTECFFRSLCTYGNGSTALRFYICAFSGSCYGRLCYDLYASLLRICCSADRGIHFPRCCFKDIGAFRQVVRPSGVLTCLCSDAWKLRTDSIRTGCRTDPWIYRYGILDLVQSPSAYFQQSDPGRYAALACRTDAAKQWKYPVQCDHQSARHPWNCAPASKIPLHSWHLQQ